VNKVTGLKKKLSETSDTTAFYSNPIRAIISSQKQKSEHQNGPEDHQTKNREHSRIPSKFNTFKL